MFQSPCHNFTRILRAHTSCLKNIIVTSLTVRVQFVNKIKVLRVKPAYFGISLQVNVRSSIKVTQKARSDECTSPVGEDTFSKIICT